MSGEQAATVLLDRAHVPQRQTVGMRIECVYQDSPDGIMFHRLSSGERVLVRVAQFLYNGGADPSIGEIIGGVDRVNLTVILELLAGVYVDR